jgi:hypothetical protein
MEVSKRWRITLAPLDTVERLVMNSFQPVCSGETGRLRKALRHPKKIV